jgi:meiotic recombination protein REC8, fungi type
MEKLFFFLPNLFNVLLENPLPLLRMRSDFSRATSPTTSFSAQLLSQDQEQPLPLRDITTEEQNKSNQADPTKKAKRTRLLLDARTELTDDELRVRFYAFKFDGYSIV